MSTRIKRKAAKLSPELIKALKNSPFVVSYTDCSIRWSKKIYEDFCREYDEGITAPQIMRNHGFDPELLGDSRIGAFRVYYRRKCEAEGKQMAKHPLGGAAKSTIIPDAKNKNVSIEHRVAFLAQEVDFLKKIFLSENPHLEK